MSLKISRILHAGYIFEYEGTTLAFDPIFENPFSRNCYAFPDVRFDYAQIKKLRLDAVVISHHHDDHCSLMSLDLLDRQTPIYLYCIYDELFVMIRRLGFEHVHALEIDAPISIGSFEITPCRAVDEDVDSIFHVRAGDLNVLNVVDAWIHPTALDQLAAFAPSDMVLWPFQTMRELEVVAPSRALPPEPGIPPEFAEQLTILDPRFVVPSSCQFMHESWSWYNRALFPVSYARFQVEIETTLSGVQVVRMDPSVSIVLTKNSIQTSAALTWVEPVGDQNVDYIFEAETPAPSTAEIAGQFAPLSEEQTAVALRYCSFGLVDKHTALKIPMDDYFNTPKVWRLSVYDHRGKEFRFYYRIEADKIELLETFEGDVEWLTELPISKLFAALECGETFTSMYFRINDIAFGPSVEKVVSDVDFSADPLVRCLFGDEFASYQRDQLNCLMR